MKNKKNFWVIFLLISSFLIRLINLSQSLWLDEATTAKVARSFSLFQIITKFSPTDFHPPLYYLFMKLWTNIFGYSEIALRMPSVIFSVLTGYVIYLIGKKLKDRKTGLWAAAFFLLNPLIVYYSQEARMYALVTLELTSSLIFFIFIQKVILACPESDPGCASLTRMTMCLLFNLFLILSFYTFYGSVFMISAFFIYLLFKKQYRFLIISSLIFLLSVLLISPLLLRQFSNSKTALTLMPNWKQVLGPASIKNLMLIFTKFAFGRISFYPKKIYYLVSGVWTVIIFFFVLRGSLKNKFLGFLFFIPIILGLIFSFWSPLLQYFRFLYLIPVLSILLSLGLLHQPQFKCSSLAIMVVLSMVYLLNSIFHREDWKSLVRDLDHKSKIYMIQSSSDPVLYYKPNININDLKTVKKIDDKKIVVIPYTADIHGVNYQTNLVKQGFFLENKKTFRELVLEYWSK